MMPRNLLPIVEHLRDAPNHQERAEWLCTVPEGVIQRDHLNIRELLKRDGFEAGDAYLSALVAKINARRLKDGSYPLTILMAVEHTRLQMMHAVRGKGE